MKIELDDYTIYQAMMEKFRQSLDRFSDDRHAIMKDCGISQASYYKYKKMLESKK